MLEKFLWTQKMSARPRQGAGVRQPPWAGLCPVCPLLSICHPGSDNVLCFPTHQNTDSERNREQKRLSYDIHSAGFHLVPGL